MNAPSTDRVGELTLVRLLNALANDCDETDGWQDAAATVRNAAEALTVMREALTPSVETKAAYMGEFSFTIEEGEYGSRIIPVPWTTIKEIMAAIRDFAKLSHGSVAPHD
jgi:hypothetical protein